MQLWTKEKHEPRRSLSPSQTPLHMRKRRLPTGRLSNVPSNPHSRAGGEKIKKHWYFSAAGWYLALHSAFFWGGGRGPKIDEQSIIEQLKTLDSLSQTTLHFTNIERFADVDEFYGWDASDYNSFILSYEGSAKAAVDPKGVKVEIKGKTVTVTLPAATVLSTEVAEDSISLVKDGKLESIQLTDLDGFKENQKSVIDAKVTAGQLLFDASAKAKVSATALTQAFCGEKYDVVIK